MTVRKYSWQGVVAFAFLLAFLVLPWKAAFPKNGRHEVKRYMVSATVPVAPAPTGACAGSVAHCIVIGWNSVIVSGTASYDVFRSTTSGTGYVKISALPVATTGFEDDNVVGGTTYFYVVVAYNTVGTATSGPSPNSAQVSATGLPIPNPPQVTGLVVVSNQ